MHFGSVPNARSLLLANHVPHRRAAKATLTIGEVSCYDFTSPANGPSQI